MSEPSHRSKTLRHIATNLSDPESILNEINNGARSGRLKEAWRDRPGEHPLPEMTPTEALVAQIWAEVLGVPDVHACDDFFELGGHSLLATRVIGRLRDTFGVELPLAVIFESGFTVAELARQVERFQVANGQVEQIEELLAGVAQLSEREVDDLVLRYTRGEQSQSQRTQEHEKADVDLRP